VSFCLQHRYEKSDGRQATANQEPDDPLQERHILIVLVLAGRFRPFPLHLVVLDGCPDIHVPLLITAFLVFQQLRYFRHDSFLQRRFPIPETKFLQPAKEPVDFSFCVLILI